MVAEQEPEAPAKPEFKSASLANYIPSGLGGQKQTSTDKAEEDDNKAVITGNKERGSRDQDPEKEGKEDVDKDEKKDSSGTENGSGSESDSGR